MEKSELKENKPTLQQKAPSGISGGKIQPGSPLKSENVPVGINKTRFESDKHADKRMNKMFKETGQPTLGVWNHDKRDNPMAKADKVQFNPALNKTKQINASLANKPIGKPVPDFENNQKIIDQDLAPKNGGEEIKNPEPLTEEDERKQASELFGIDLNKPEANEPDTSPLDINDMPGTPVVTSRLKDFMRYYLKQEGISPEFSETMINNIGNNPRQADWFKQKMKEYVDSKNGGNQ